MIETVESSDKLKVRFLSIDVFKGLTVVLMVFVNTLAIYENVPSWSKHAGDFGLTYVDLIAPFFVFMLALNMNISYQKRKEKFGRKKAVLRFIRKFLIFITIIGSVLYSNFNESLSFSWYFILVLILYPFWGLIQQFMMLGIISQNLASATEGKMNRYLIIFLVSALFSMVHYPSFFLMIFTFFLEVVFITIYLKWRNLWAIGIAHGWIATFILYYVLDRNLWSELFSIF